MSYILDALKKADAERERGTVPGLHSQPEPLMLESQPESTLSGLGWAVWAVAALLAVLVVLVAWRMWRPHEADATPAAASRMAAGATAQPTSNTVVSFIPTPITETTPEPPAPVAEPTAPSPPGAASSSKAVPGLSTSLATTHRAHHADTETGVAAKSKEGARAGGATAKGTEKGTEKSTARRLYTLNELPEEVRRDMPQFTVSGSMYSDLRANRMLIVNGQIYHEGNQPVPDLVLEEIKLRSAVFRYKGYRYLVGY